MMSDLLSQDEINALLSGGMIESSGESSSSAGSSGGLSPADDSTLQDISSVFASSLQSVFVMLTGKNVKVEKLSAGAPSQMEIISSMEPNPFVLRTKCGGMGDSLMAIAIPQRGAQTLSDMMMGGEGKDLSGVLSELDISASQEGISQVIGSAFTSLSSKLSGSRLMPEGITAIVEGDGWELFPGETDPELCAIKLKVSIPEVTDFEMFVVLHKTMVSSFTEKITAAQAAASEKSAPKPPAQPYAPAPQASAPQPQFNLPMGGFPQQTAPVVDVRPAEFSALAAKGGSGVPSRIDLVADIPVRVTVELGRTRKNISEILNMSAGSVIELDKMAGEPVDVLVNGKLIAKGEVVVIDENFGVRISEIINSVSKAYS